MSKTFEEITRPDNGPLVELNNSMQEVFSQYRKMREYASYLEYELKQKDEHIQKVENENSFLRDKHTTFDSNGNSIEPIIPQQILPVVPECVAQLVEYAKNSKKTIRWFFTEEAYMFPEAMDHCGMMIVSITMKSQGQDTKRVVILSLSKKLTSWKLRAMNRLK